MKTRLHGILDVLAGVLWTLAFPPFSFFPFMGICFWIFQIYWLQRLFSAPNARAGFWRGFWFGFGVQWAAFYWIVHTMYTFGQLPYPIGIFGTSLFVMGSSIAYGIQGWLISKARSYGSQISVWAVNLGVTSLLVMFDVYFPELFPWDAALAFAPFPFWLQTLDIAGTVFVSFMLYGIGVYLWQVFWLGPRCTNPLSRNPLTGGWRPPGRFQWSQHGRLGLLYFALIVICLVKGFQSEKYRSETPKTTVKLAGIQANIGSADKVSAARLRIDEKMDEVLRRYLRLSEQTSGVDLIIWPETAFPDYLAQSFRRREEVLSTAKRMGTDFLIGSFDVRRSSAGMKVLNGLFLMDSSQGQVTQEYIKHRLLAFGEYLPLGSTFPKLKSFFPMVSDFSAGPGPATLPWKGYQIGTSICYEAILPSFIRELRNLNPDFFLNVTNDSWFGDTREPWFHLYLQMMRSVEHRIPAFRLANTGVSAFINRYGDVLQATPYNSEAVLSVEMPLFDHQPTMYHRFGYWFFPLILFVLLGWSIRCLRMSA